MVVLVTCKTEEDPIKYDSLFPTQMMLQMKFNCDLPAGLRDVNIRKYRQSHRRTLARWRYYKLTFGSGELKISDDILLFIFYC